VSRPPRAETALRSRPILALGLSAALGASAASPGLSQPVTPAAAPAQYTELARQVRAEFLHAWRGYESLAWGHDELKPVSGAARDWYGTSLWMTPVDALDTMLLMGLTDEAAKTREAIATRLSFDRDILVKNFEITIRLLGGLLSSYQMTGDRRLLVLAEDLGRRLLPAFGSPTGMPYMYVNLKTGRTRGAISNPAEVGTLILEFGTLSRLTHDRRYFERARRALLALAARRGATGLVGEQINVETGAWVSRESHIGGGIDSYYEYLVKCGILFNDGDCTRLGRESLRSVDRFLADERGGRLWYGAADMETGRRTATTYGALQAFFPAVLALSGNLRGAQRLQESNLAMWTLHGVEPEEVDYATGRVTADGYALRPEIIESAYYLFRFTRDPKYLEMGRRFFDDLRNHCRVEHGYTVLESVVTKKRGDLMPSYFLAETLKYLYLLFRPEAVNFGRVIFNTEAHPLQRAGP
jgi:glycosyl hydrolase family 47